MSINDESVRYDYTTRKWFAERPVGTQTTVAKCDCCGYYYKPDLGHKCKKGRKKMTLEQTVALMNSADYADRFVAEYWQTKIRYDRLHSILIKYEAGTLSFTPDCSLELLKEQARHMGDYLRVLEVRAEIEKINLLRG